MKNGRGYFLRHASLGFHFAQSARDFTVEEVPLYPFSGEGEHLMVRVRKKGLATPEMIRIFSDSVGVKSRDVGYAGLKDKMAMTIQWISLPKTFREKVEAFEHDQIKVLETAVHGNKLRLGHLKGNRFFIRLKKVNPTDKVKIDQALKTLKEQGMPNFFGYQRFGRDGDNHIQGQKIANGEKKERNKKVKNLLLSAYQSALFNDWLTRRIQISHLAAEFSPAELGRLLPFPEETLKSFKEQKPFFKILPGDVMRHYPAGNLYVVEDPVAESVRFADRASVPSGPLPGGKLFAAKGEALEEEKAFHAEIPSVGDRRYAWVFPEEVEGVYREEEAWYELRFFLPKGCYATTLIEELKRGPLQ